MINKNIITQNEISEIVNKLKIENKKVILVGGCFDIIHAGHIQFLQNAKKLGDILIVLLESDERIKKLKGSERPINTQADRAIILSSLRPVDYVILLPNMQSDQEYDSVISQIKPAIIATTSGDPSRHHKERQAQLFGGTVVDVIKRLTDLSTTKLTADLYKKEL